MPDEKRSSKKESKRDKEKQDKKSSKKSKSEKSDTILASLFDEVKKTDKVFFSFKIKITNSFSFLSHPPSKNNNQGGVFKVRKCAKSITCIENLL